MSQPDVADLVGRAQISDYLRQLNLRANLFTEDDMRVLENGYSVSETDNDDNESEYMGRESRMSPHYRPQRRGFEEHKASYNQKMGGLERLVEQLRAEKRSLQLEMDLQRQNANVKILQKEQEAQAKIKEVRDY